MKAVADTAAAATEAAQQDIENLARMALAKYPAPLGVIIHRQEVVVQANACHAINWSIRGVAVSEAGMLAFIRDAGVGVGPDGKGPVMNQYNSTGMPGFPAEGTPRGKGWW